MRLSKVIYRDSYIHMVVVAMQEQFGVQDLAQGHFNMQTRGIIPATSVNKMLP